MLIFRQLFDPQSSTYTYLLADSDAKQAVLIDPVFEQVRRDAALIDELGLDLLYTLDTHVHADHVTGAWLMSRQCASLIALSARGGAAGADRLLEDGEKIEFGGRYVTAVSTPGHTNGCMSFVLDDETMAFTGDALLIRGCGRTDFQQGSPQKLYQSIRMKIFSLPGNCLLYPGHDYRGLTVTSVDEEKAHNPRLGGDIAEADFAGYMENLGLAHPRQIDIAVPANLVCGKPAKEDASLEGPGWAPLTFTFAGFWEIQPHWVEEHAAEVQIVDVREESEYAGPMGHIPGSTLIPLGELENRAGDLSPDTPIVTVCRSGARSAQAAVILKRAGIENVANLAGGMLRWRAQQLPTEGAKD